MSTIKLNLNKLVLGFFFIFMETNNDKIIVTLRHHHHSFLTLSMNSSFCIIRVGAGEM